MIPERIQLKRVRGWCQPDGTIRCCRPTKWGNPFRIVRARGRWHIESELRTYTMTVDFESEELAVRCAIDLHRKALLLIGGLPVDADDVRRDLKPAKFLGCWCKSTDPCHVDNYLAVLRGEL